MRKHRLIRTTFVAAAGAATMYFADPEHGPVRRALARQRFSLFKDRAEELVVEEPMATSDAMVDLRQIDLAEIAIIEVIEPEGEEMDLPAREPISDETMTIDEAIFHAARTS